MKKIGFKNAKIKEKKRNAPIKTVKELYFKKKDYHKRLKEIKENFEEDF